MKRQIDKVTLQQALSEEIRKFAAARDKRDLAYKNLMDLENELANLTEEYMAGTCKLAEESCLIRTRTQKMQVKKEELDKLKAGLEDEPLDKLLQILPALSEAGELVFYSYKSLIMDSGSDVQKIIKSVSGP